MKCQSLSVVGCNKYTLFMVDIFSLFVFLFTCDSLSSAVLQRLHARVPSQHRASTSMARDGQYFLKERRWSRICSWKYSIKQSILYLYVYLIIVISVSLKAPYPGMDQPPHHPYYQHHPPPPQAHPPYSGHHTMPHDARFREKRVVRSFSSSLVRDHLSTFPTLPTVHADLSLFKQCDAAGL